MADQQLSHLLSTVVQGFFTSESDGLKPIKPPPKVGGGHPGDELITDDLDLFLEELAAIPLGEVTIDDRDASANAEAIGACLYRLSYCPREQNAKTIYEKLSKLFDVANEESWKVVRAYADLLLGPERRSKGGREHLRAPAERRSAGPGPGEWLLGHKCGGVRLPHRLHDVSRLSGRETEGGPRAIAGTLLPGWRRTNSPR
jgi:hypothetical protein